MTRRTSGDRISSLTLTRKPGDTIWIDGETCITFLDRHRVRIHAPLDVQVQRGEVRNRDAEGDRPKDSLGS